MTNEERNFERFWDTVMDTRIKRVTVTDLLLGLSVAFATVGMILG